MNHDPPKAAVTTVLPKWGGPVDCLISLDIRKAQVHDVALALFSAEVTWVQQDLHILRDGFTIVSSGPSAEVTLKGATKDAIIKVFGSETCDAVSDSPICKREREEGRQLTQCVSMYITNDGGIISLSLSLQSAPRIYSILYT